MANLTTVAFAFPVAVLAATALQAQSPADLLSRPDKTELADEYGNVAATGGAFGIPWMWWWHRINAGWGSVRPRVAELTVFDEEDRSTLALAGGQRLWTPNQLHQEMEVKGLRFSEDKFLDLDSMAVLLRVRNTTGRPRKLRLYFRGKSEGRCRIRFDRERNALLLTETKDYGKLYLPGRILLHQWIGCSRPVAGWAIGSFDGDVEKYFGRDIGFGALINDANLRRFVSEFEGNGFYYAFQVNLDLEAGGTETLTLTNTFSTDEPHGNARRSELLAGAAALLDSKQRQARRYFSDAVPELSTPDEKLNRLWYHLWYVLGSNRVRKGQTVKADFNVPTKFGYWGCYVWDTAFHVVGQSLLKDKRIAEDSIRALLSMQYPNGFIPVNSGADNVEVISKDGPTYNLDPRDFYRYEELSNPFYSRLEFRHPTPHVWGLPQTREQIDVAEKSQTPILAMSLWELYKYTGDQAFLAEIYPRLAKYDDWMWRRRNTGDGLLVWYHGDEAWDNATRMFPLPTKTVDGSATAYLQRKILAGIAGILGREEDAAKFQKRADLTRQSITEKMWNERDSFYHDLSYDDLLRPQKSLAGFLPLLAEIASPGQLQALRKHLRDPNEFWTPYPVPTLSRDDPDFDARTWGLNGPVWVPTNWFVMEGLARAGDVEIANEILQKTVEMMSKPTGYPTAAEQYNPETGVFFGVADYSWCGVLNHYITKWVLGIQPDAASGQVVIHPHLPSPWKFARLNNLQIGEHELSVAYEYAPGRRAITLRHSGKDALAADVILPVPGTVQQVRVAGKALAAVDYHVQNGNLDLKTSLGNEPKTIEVVYR